MTSDHSRRISDSLTRELARRQLIVVSNREPRVDEIGPDGSIVTRRPVSGVVTALDPVLRSTGGTWIARGSGNADRTVVDARDHVTVEGDGGEYTLRRVWLTRAEERGHYDGFSNTGLWPLCHVAFEPPTFRRGDWVQYQAVNRRFADAVVSEARDANPIVFVQDYHFALLPRLIRERLPHAVIAAFWHVPWPNRARFERCPYGTALLESMLGADLLGFQTDEHVAHFLDCVRAVRGAAVHHARGNIVCNRASTVAASFPVSVEFPSRWSLRLPAPLECRRRVAADLGVDTSTPLVLSVDRLDYTKGIEERLAAIRRLLSRGSEDAQPPVFVQVAPPTRTNVARYRDFSERVRARVADLNDRFARPGYRPVVMIDRHVEPEDVCLLYRAADVCHVNSLDDGMNLVAKEFAASREDERGVLVLSRFTGAARALEGAVLVNPYDVDAAADAMRDALRMPAAEQRARMRSMRAQVRNHDVFHWAEAILTAAATMRQSETEVATVFPA